MNEQLPIITLAPCPKGYTRDLDKTMSPAQTIARVRERLDSSRLDILSKTRRVDVGRLGIPVFLSVCGADARRIIAAFEGEPDAGNVEVDRRLIGRQQLKGARRMLGIDEAPASAVSRAPILRPA